MHIALDHESSTSAKRWNMMKKYLVAAALSLPLLFPAPTFAQWDYRQDMVWNMVESRIDIRKTRDRMRARRNSKPSAGTNKPRRTRRTTSAKAPRRAAAPAKAAPEAPSAPVEDDFAGAARATSFKFSGSSVMSKQLAQAMISKAEDRPAAAKTFASCLQKGRSYLRSNADANLPADNVARALAFSLTTLHALALSRPGEKMGQDVPIPSPAQSDALRAQVALALSSDPKFRAQTSRQKQEAFEMLVITTVFAETLYSAGGQKDDAGMQEAASGMAREALQELLGVEPEKMQFTEAGLQF